MSNTIITAEAMASGHPDKVSDFISDSILDACLTQDPNSRVGCETLVKGNTVVLAGEITSSADLNLEKIVRKAVREIGYCTPQDDPVFYVDNLHIINLLTKQSPDIAQGVDAPEQGAGDQGIMYGYATSETPEHLPMPITLANRIMYNLDQVRHSGAVSWLRPDGKCQVAVEYVDGKPSRVVNVVMSVQHAPDVSSETIRAFCIQLAKDTIPAELVDTDTAFFINPTGRFVLGGPQADCGLTGRKIIADTYGGIGRHGGGAFSGKDCSKVDRSAAYMCRWVALQVLHAGLADWCEVQIAYAIGKAEPVSIHVESNGDNAMIEKWIQDRFSFKPADIEERLELRRPIFRFTTNYGHFGKSYLPWEKV